MDRTTSTIIVVALIVLALIGMFFGWRARKGRQSFLPRPLAVPDDAGKELFSQKALYVATTIAHDPLNRVAVTGLGFRARATVVVTDAGVILSLAGSDDVFIPKSDLRDVERATWTIDRVVESGGLVLLAWNLGDTAVDSYLRVSEPADPTPLIEALSRLVIVPTAPAEQNFTESETNEVQL